ncbi:hypothetical protein [Aureispira sp. CCB-E]|uniref:hypothetical protein n=1 Tax=Aureispira sp. CCB-E TaxID=3051121 RepID=UPI002868AFA2|nr:hypothetical protein [Aureispira sp. CCB-E]WMX13733.1 hypothetical protein QP953_23055 [Aureispira sp. CCB-E]
MKKNILYILTIILSYSYHIYATHNTNHADSIELSIQFYSDYPKPFNAKILNEEKQIILSLPFKPSIQHYFIEKGNYILQIEHPTKNLIIDKAVELDSSMVAIEINISCIQSASDSSSSIYVYKHYENDLNLVLSPHWSSKKKKSTFQSSIIPDFVLTNTHDSVVYGIRYHFSLSNSSTLLAIPKLDTITYPFIMVKNKTNWDVLDCTPPDFLMNLKKGEKGKMRTSRYSICTNEDFDKNNLYKLVVPYGINNAIREKIDTNFFYTEQKIYKVSEQFIFATPKIKLKS